jgi:hypothetical protein
MMRALALSVAAALAATDGGAQAPLTIDTSFHFYYSADLMEYWSEHYAGGGGMWQPNIGEVLLRNNGNVLATGNDLIKPLHEVPWGGRVSVEFAAHGDGSPLHYRPSCTGSVIEIPGTDMYMANNKRKFNDCQTDYSFGSPDIYIANRTLDGWYAFEDSSALSTGYFRITQSDPLRYALIKVDKWGELDTTFTHRSASGDVYGKQLRRLRNGQFLFNGKWTHYEGRPTGTIIRINADGSQDTTFNTIAWSSEMQVVYEQPDGKVVLGGMFRLLGIPDTLNLIRLNTDGSLDHTFNNFNHLRIGYFGQGSAMAAGVGAIVPLDEGRLFVGGAFTRVDDAPRGCMACVDTAGNLLDCWAGGGLHPMNYSSSGWPNVGLSGMKTLANGETYIYGCYKGITDANGYHREQVCVSRLYMPDVGVAEKPMPVQALAVWPNPGGEALHVNWSGKAIQALELRDALGRLALRTERYINHQPLDASALAPGTYTVLARTANGERAAAKWIKP